MPVSSGVAAPLRQPLHVVVERRGRIRVELGHARTRARGLVVDHVEQGVEAAVDDPEGARRVERVAARSEGRRLLEDRRARAALDRRMRGAEARVAAPDDQHVRHARRCAATRCAAPGARILRT
jgi:hypothetical protein